MTAEEIAGLVDGTVHGDADAEVDAAAPVHQSTTRTLTFAADETNLRRLASCNARVAILSTSAVEGIRKSSSLTLIAVSGDVEEAFLRAARALHPRRDRQQTGVSPAANVSSSAVIGGDSQIHPNVTISDDAQLGTGCTIFPGVYIGRGVRVGNHVTIYPNAVIYDDVSIGDHCVIHANAVIGADGFGYRVVDGRHTHVPHLGTVRIEDHVEIGACTTIDRAKVGATVIGAGTKIDNLVMVGHNCELGPHNLLASQVGFAGSVTTGAYVVCAGQVGVADHVHLGDGAIFGAQCGVARSMPPQQTYLGAPAAPIDETRRQLMALRKLPDMRRTVRALEKQVAGLLAQTDPASSPQRSPLDDAA